MKWFISLKKVANLCFFCSNFSTPRLRSFTHGKSWKSLGGLESLSAPVETQLHAAMALRLLAKHNQENCLKIARADAVRPLVALLSHPNPQLQEHGVTAILNLSICHENKDPIAATGAIRPLVHTLKTGTPAARENAAIALLRLSEIEEHKIAIGRSDQTRI